MIGGSFRLVRLLLDHVSNIVHRLLPIWFLDYLVGHRKCIESAVQGLPEAGLASIDGITISDSSHEEGSEAVLAEGAGNLDTCIIFLFSDENSVDSGDVVDYLDGFRPPHVSAIVPVLVTLIDNMRKVSVVGIEYVWLEVPEPFIVGTIFVVGHDELAPVALEAAHAR